MSRIVKLIDSGCGLDHLVGCQIYDAFFEEMVEVVSVGAVRTNDAGTKYRVAKVMPSDRRAEEMSAREFDELPSITLGVYP